MVDMSVLGNNLGGGALAPVKIRKKRAPRADVAAGEISAEAADLGQARVRIVLEDNEAIPPTGLFIGFNGRGFLLKASVEVAVPLGVKNILDDAVMAMPEIDPQSLQITGYRERMRYPYRLVQ